MTLETVIKGQIKDWLTLKGWFIYYNLQGLGSYEGIPYLISIKKSIFGLPIVLFIEVKTPRGRQSENQKKFQADIEAHGGCYVLAACYEDVEKYIKDKKINLLIDELK